MPNFMRVSNETDRRVVYGQRVFSSPREQIFSNNGGEKKVLRTGSARKNDRYFENEH